MQCERFVNDHHSYIAWADRPSRKLYWRLFDGEKAVGVFGLGSAFARPKAIAEWMDAHGVAFNELGNNIVYCLHSAPKNAGSQFLKLIRRDAVLWWRERYGDELKAMQTFILPPRNGATYLADNWQMIGMTSGHSQSCRTIYGDEEVEGAETRTFKNGETKRLLREYVDTDRKLIFVRTLDKIRPCKKQGLFADVESNSRSACSTC